MAGRFVKGGVSMWLHRDLAWWGVFLGALALLLMFPANIVANLVTPKLKNWWSERSAASTRKRIEKLEKELASSEQYKELSELEDYAVKAIEGIGILAVVCLGILAITLLTDTTSVRLVTAFPGIRLGMVILALFSVVFGFLINFLVFNKLGELRKKQSPFDRKVLRKSIENLKAKLARMQ